MPALAAALAPLVGSAIQLGAVCRLSSRPYFTAFFTAARDAFVVRTRTRSHRPDHRRPERDPARARGPTASSSLPSLPPVCCAGAMRPPCSGSSFTTGPSGLFFGGRRPGELSQSSIWAAVSRCRALLKAESRRGPQGSNLGPSRKLRASSRSRSLSGFVCLKRRLGITARSFPLEEGGSATAISSQIKAKVRAVMTRQCLRYEHRLGSFDTRPPIFRTSLQ